jgi:L(+)-tartrate dehydratase alpha subunit
MPRVEIRFDPAIDFLEIIGVPKGGGSEIFGTFYRMLYPSDGMRGVASFVLDCVKQSSFAGGTCPPNVVGIGLGGTADLCMRIAKEAAVLRPVGDRHPEARIADLERELLSTIEDSDIGPMGMGGRSSVLDVHVEYAVTHTAALPVAFNAQCSLCRRKVARLTADGEVAIHDSPSWNYRQEGGTA